MTPNGMRTPRAVNTVSSWESRSTSTKMGRKEERREFHSYLGGIYALPPAAVLLSRAVSVSPLYRVLTVTKCFFVQISASATDTPTQWGISAVWAKTPSALCWQHMLFYNWASTASVRFVGAFDLSTTVVELGALVVSRFSNSTARPATCSSRSLILASDCI